MTIEELKTKKISAISLGCDKNRVDLEHMLGALSDFGFEIVPNIEDAEILIVNTCAFISSAVKEAIDNIFLALKQKENKCEKVIVTGCLNERYLDSLKKEIPEVDAFVRVKDNDQILKVIFDLYEIEHKDRFKNQGRLLTTPSHYAYLKIADGCNNGCAYCTIPRIRGRYKSVPMDDVVKEAKILASMGVKELIVVAQDVSRYGEDLYGQVMLIPLLEKLSKIRDIKWIRLHYLYPEMINDELLDYIYENEKICKYLDIPLQHIDDDILREMNRKLDEAKTRELIQKIQQKYPKIALRSTYIVGFPGETKKKFNKLLDFIQQYPMPDVGFFPYYREDKTKAYYMKQIPAFKKKLRLKKIYAVQKIVSDELNSKRVGEVVEAVVDAYDEQNDCFILRDQYSSPNIDFVIEVSAQNLKIGQFYNVKLTDYKNDVFKGEIV